MPDREHFHLNRRQNNCQTTEIQINTKKDSRSNSLDVENVYIFKYKKLQHTLDIKCERSINNLKNT